MTTYRDFINHKQHTRNGSGIKINDDDLNPMLFDFQKHLVLWALSIARAAIFADCGLGKTPMQLEWSRHVARETGKPVIIFTPLAVAAQTVREGKKFGIDCHYSRDGKISGDIVITNYERIGYFDSSDFGGTCCDESSAIKHFSGERQKAVTAFMRHHQYRLLCTATAAPNDHTELGTSSEALGYLGFMDMLSVYFRNTQNTCDTATKWRMHGGCAPKWRFKKHAEEPFWRFVCSWARMIRKPSDLGFNDDGFNLPPLEIKETIVKASRPMKGKLFVEPAVNLSEQREERALTLVERCEKVAELVSHGEPAVVWCQYNQEADLLEKIIKDARQVKGSDTVEYKEQTFLDFADGNLRVLVTKPKLGGFGLNWQHCGHMTFFPSHSYEQFYQGTRRCWRFGRKEKVNVDIITTEGELAVLENMQRKSEQADKMFSQIVSNMNNAIKLDDSNRFKSKEKLPQWLS